MLTLESVKITHIFKTYICLGDSKQSVIQKPYNSIDFQRCPKNSTKRVAEFFMGLYAHTFSTFFFLTPQPMNMNAERPPVIKVLDDFFEK